MSLEELEDKFSKYEIARILGARALQVSMDAPLLLKISEQELDDVNYNPLEIAKKELLAEVLPITINRPLPKKKIEKVRVLTKAEIEEKIKKDAEAEASKEAAAEEKIEEETGKEAPKDAADLKADENLEKAEVSEEKKLEAEDAEIMELANPDDESEADLQDKPEVTEV